MRRYTNMKRNIEILLSILCILSLVGCNKGVETTYIEGIMEDGLLYEKLYAMPAEIDESAIIGYVESYTNTIPEKDGETNIGNRVRVKIVKNKVAPPFRQVEFDLLFGQGISKMGEMVDIGVDAGIIKKSGSWFSYGETKLGQGREAVKQLLADNPELQEEITAQIKEYLTQNEE